MTTPKLADRLDKHTLARLASREVTAREVAESLGVSAAYLGRILAEKGVKRVPGPILAERKQNSEVFQALQADRNVLARKVISGELTLMAACRKAGVCERTMRRHMAKVTLQSVK